MWKWKVKSLSHIWLFVTPWTVAHQAPPSMEFSRQEYWSGLPFPSPGDLPNSGIEPGSPALQADTLWLRGETKVQTTTLFLRDLYENWGTELLLKPLIWGVKAQVRAFCWWDGLTWLLKPFLHETPGPGRAHQTACAWLTGTDPRRLQQDWGCWRGAPGALGVENSERCCQGSHLCRDQEWNFSPIMQRKEMKRRLCLGQGCCVGDSQHQHTHQCSSFQEIRARGSQPLF